MASSSSPMLRALGGAWRCAREVLFRVVHETGVHLIRIDNYSRVTGTTSAAALTGHCIESARFFVGGCEWQLHFYPNGADGSASPGHTSVNLVLKYGSPWWRPFYEAPLNVTAAYEVSILDGDRNRVLGRAFRPRRFAAVCHQDPEVVATAEMRAAATRGGKEEGGGIVVRCDVTVTILEKD